jgi:hypothetical protein
VTTIPFDFVQYCVSPEQMVGENVAYKEVCAGSGETDIGIYNFNPGFNGRIKNLLVDITPPTFGITNTNISGNLYLRAKKPTDNSWTDLAIKSVTADTDFHFDLSFSSGESPITTLGDIPLLFKTTMDVTAGTEVLGADLLTSFSSNIATATVLNDGAEFYNYNVLGSFTINNTVYNNTVGATPYSLHRFEYTVTDYVSGKIKLVTGNFSGSSLFPTNSGSFVNSNGTFIEYFMPLAAVVPSVWFAGSSFYGKVRNVKIQEVTSITSPPKCLVGKSRLLVRCLGETI